MQFRFIAGLLLGIAGVIAYNKKDAIAKIAKDGFDKSKEAATQTSKTLKDKFFAQKDELCENTAEIKENA